MITICLENKLISDQVQMSFPETGKRCMEVDMRKGPKYLYLKRKCPKCDNPKQCPF